MLFMEVEDDGAISRECLLHPDDPALAQRKQLRKPSEKPAGSKIEKAVEIESESDSPNVIELPLKKLKWRKQLLTVGRFARLNFRGITKVAGVTDAAYIPEEPCSTQLDPESSGTGS